ncbi:MAG: damage-control phosphatase ARMT1 family protein [Anaerolineae bacterium]
MQLSDALPTQADAIRANVIDLQMWPRPLRTDEPGSFAQNTFKHRIPPIIDDIIASNTFPPDILAALQALRDEITSGVIQPLSSAEPDAGFWNTISAPHIGRAWLDAPWYWAEAYFYRRVLECTRYFDAGHAWHNIDPYANKKLAELRPNATPSMAEALLATMPVSFLNKRFKQMCYASLWGNRADLSYNVSLTVTPAASLEDERSHLLIDDTEAVWEFLSRSNAPTLRVAIVTDNCGSELLMDLALADFLLDNDLAAEVTLQLKNQPFFVSDAMPRDVLDSLAALAQSGPHTGRLASRLRDHIATGRLRLRAHWFYTTCLMYAQLPDDLRAELAGFDLVILKGDANYRRLLGDAHWDPTTPFAQAVAYFPTRLLALRTLKAELIVGLAPGVAEHLFAVEPDWRTNGRRGVAQARL